MSTAQVFRVAVMLTWLGTRAIAGAPSDELEGETFFEGKIRPVLAGTCFPCHGGEKVSGGLRVDARESLLKGGDLGPAVVPGDPDGSLLIQAIRHEDAFLKMPPGKERLPDEVVGRFTDWIKAGAVWPESPGDVAEGFASRRHWAFEPVRVSEPPLDPTGWSDHPIDSFIVAGWLERGLEPVRLADRRTLLRRVSFDLIGLPPSPEDMADFLADVSPDAFERVVERLLASPQYGERWGRHWMDIVRYADTAGDNADYPIPESRLYRDYIIDSFNADKPFDVFVREQLAGDILARQGPPERHADNVIATGFLALSRRYATAPYELWHLTLEDTIETTGSAFLGLTLRCARCHDHKFDPIPTEDYYALYGIFASTTFPYAGSEEFQSMNKPREHFVPLLQPDAAGPRLADYHATIADLEARIRHLEGERSGRDSEEARRIDEDLNRLRGELRTLRRPGLPPGVPGAYAVTEGRPTNVPVQRGGDPNKPGPVVPRGVPGFLHNLPPPAVPEGASGRLRARRVADSA